MTELSHIRNFSIIAHIDHGKSTLADRFIQHCGGLSEREMASQVLDSMDLERERGITIKAQSVTLHYQAEDGETYQLNFIDTPGHVDFSYEVSRSLSACEGALLVVDAGQGVEAQSVANCYTAIEQGLEVLPVLNKMDLPQADPERVQQEIEEIIGIDATEAVATSAKTGMGIEALLEQLIQKIPAPGGDREAPLQALIIDSWFDNYLGVVSLVRVVQGQLSKRDKFIVSSTGKQHQADMVGVFTPRRTETGVLRAGGDGRRGLGGRTDGPRDGVRRGLGGDGGTLEDVLGDTWGRLYGVDGRRARREGAGLVQHDRGGGVGADRSCMGAERDGVGAGGGGEGGASADGVRRSLLGRPKGGGACGGCARVRTEDRRCTHDRYRSGGDNHRA